MPPHASAVETPARPTTSKPEAVPSPTAGQHHQEPASPTTQGPVAYNALSPSSTAAVEHGQSHTSDEHKRKLAELSSGDASQAHQQAAHNPAAFCEPLLASSLGESISSYFGRLAPVVDISQFRKVEAVGPDGVYVHKRPIRSASGGNSPLAVCGSIMHHCIIYVKEAGVLHSLDFGPNNGMDVTANIMEDSPCRSVRASNLAGPPPDDTLPLLFLGPSRVALDSLEVKQAVQFAEQQAYNAMRNNCIHFADFIVRVLTAGSVRGAPLLYDLVAGDIPPVDHPLLVMMQMMMQMSWHAVCDGSRLCRKFVAWRDDSTSKADSSAVPAAAAVEVQPSKGQQEYGAAAAAAISAAIAASIAGQSAEAVAAVAARAATLAKAPEEQKAVSD